MTSNRVAFLQGAGCAHLTRSHGIGNAVERRVAASAFARRRIEAFTPSLRRAAVLCSSSTNSGPGAGTTEATKSAVAKVKAFLTDAGDLGTVRFIVISDGAVLETIGRFDYGQSEFSIPGRGEYVTIATEDRTFECHVNASAVRRITMSEEPTKDGKAVLPVIRFLGDGPRPLLSVSLMWDPSQGPGHYLHGAREAFAALREQYGEDFTV